MEPSELVSVLSRWVHVGAAIVMLGGSVFMRFALMPAARSLPDAEHQALRERVMGAWRKFVAAGILLLLLSGFYNYLVISIPAHKGQGLYHGLMGVKIILALVVFFLASALTGRSKALEGIRQNAARWLGITILLAALVVAIAGYLKVAIPGVDAESEEEGAARSRSTEAALIS